VLKHFDGSDRAPIPPPRELLRGAVGEFLAMTLFVYFGCGAASSNAHFSNTGEWNSASVLTIALAFGLGTLVLVYATAHTSGGHINCAVTLALTIVGTCHPVRAVVYLLSQLAGSVLGAALLSATTTSSGGLDRSGALGSNGLQNASVSIGNAFIVELMGTFLLCFVVLETAVNTKCVTTDGESVIRGNKQNLAPLPIGFAVFLAHVVCIPITGCSINPTRSFGPALVSGTWDDHWVWWVAPLTGSAVASGVWGLTRFLEGEPATDEEEATRAKV